MVIDLVERSVLEISRADRAQARPAASQTSPPHPTVSPPPPTTRHSTLVPAAWRGPCLVKTTARPIGPAVTTRVRHSSARSVETPDPAA